MVKKLLFISVLILFSFTSSEKIYTGVASYYGQHWTGRLTSSGERFHCDSLTAAHKYFKFGTIVKVTNLSNDSVILVRVNDRLPKSSSRLIDLSYGAAKELNFIKKGLTKVSIQPI
jgi:rare lipoprotein A